MSPDTFHPFTAFRLRRPLPRQQLQSTQHRVNLSWSVSKIAAKAHGCSHSSQETSKNCPGDLLEPIDAACQKLVNATSLLTLVENELKAGNASGAIHSVHVVFGELSTLKEYNLLQVQNKVTEYVPALGESDIRTMTNSSQHHRIGFPEFRRTGGPRFVHRARDNQGKISPNGLS